MGLFAESKAQFEAAHQEAIGIINQCQALTDEYYKLPWGSNTSDDQIALADGTYNRLVPLLNEARGVLDKTWKDYQYMLNGVAVKKVSYTDANWQMIDLSMRIAEHLEYLVGSGISEMGGALEVKCRSMMKPAEQPVATVN